MSSSALMATCKINVQIASYNVATKELKPCKRKGTPAPTERDRASDDLDLAFWLEKSLSPSPDLIAIGFQELLPQTDLHLLTIPSEQSIFFHDQGLSLETSSTNAGLPSLPSSSSLASLNSSTSASPVSYATRLGSQNIVGLEGWIEKLQESISRIHGVQGPKYNILWAGRRAGLGLVVFSKDGLLVHNLYSGSIGSGIGGIYGNKGAIGCAIEFKMDKRQEKTSTFSFLNSHLGPHEGESYCRWRIDESDHILSSLLLKSFPDPSNPLIAFNFLHNQPPTTNHVISILPQDSEVIFFFGDLNFRMRGSKTDWAIKSGGGKEGLPKRTELMSMIDGQMVEALVEKDELTYLRSKKHGVLSQFSEAPITFLPSYKLNQNSKKKSKDEPLLPPSSKDRTYSTKRLPAYCDRILYYSDTRHSITSLHYTRVTDYSWSDHDPVVALFHLEQVLGIGEKKIVNGGRDVMPIIQARLSRVWNCNFRFIVAILVLLAIRFSWPWLFALQ